MNINEEKYHFKSEQNRSNIIQIKNINNTYSINKAKEDEDKNWKNKKINLNFFENKNLIKELRAKYLPNSHLEQKKEKKSEIYLNNINNLNNEKKEFFIEKQSFSSISKEENNMKLNEQNIKNNNYNEKEYDLTEKEIINNINEKNKEGYFKKKQRIGKDSKNKNIIIENRFYTEIVNSNILLDNKLILCSLQDESISSKINKDKKINNIIKINNRKNIEELNLLRNANNGLNRNGNQYISLSMKHLELESNNQINAESYQNKENLENIFNNNIEEKNKKDIDNQKENIDFLKLETNNMKREIKNYEKLTSSLIDYINDINHILDQKEINPDDIPKIVKNENESLSNYYIANLIRHLNDSKNSIAYKLDHSRKKIKNKRNIMRNPKNNKLNQYNKKYKKINRSAEDINNIRAMKTRKYSNKSSKGNYFYEDSSDKYIFDYYKNRNINCSACLLGNNISQRGYSPEICCHLDDNDENDISKEIDINEK